MDNRVQYVKWKDKCFLKFLQTKNQKLVFFGGYFNLILQYLQPRVFCGISLLAMQI